MKLRFIPITNTKTIATKLLQDATIYFIYCILINFCEVHNRFSLFRGYSVM